MGREKFRKNKGDGPGGPSVAGNWGVGASYNYGDEQIVDLMAGSSGSSGRFFQGSGAGGGAIELKAQGGFSNCPGDHNKCKRWRWQN